MHYFQKKKRDDGLPDPERESSAEIPSHAITQANFEVRQMELVARKRKEGLIRRTLSLFMLIFWVLL